MDYISEIQDLKLFLDAEKSTSRRLRELLNMAIRDRDMYRDKVYVLQDENDDLKGLLNNSKY